MSYKPSERGKLLWTHMVKRYTIKFAHDNGQTCREDWDALVQRSTDAALRTALEKCKTQHPQYAPTLPQFQTLVELASGPANTGPSAAWKLCEYVIANRKLTGAQLRSPWTYLGGDRGESITGVVVPALDGVGYRVLVEDMQAFDPAPRSDPKPRVRSVMEELGDVNWGSAFPDG